MKNNSGLIELSPALLNQISGGCIGFGCGGSTYPFDMKNSFLPPSPPPLKPKPLPGEIIFPINPISPKVNLFD